MRRPMLLATTLAVLLAACGGGTPPAPRTEPAAAPTTPTTPTSAAPAPVRAPEVTGVVARDLAVPWGLDFLPGGDALVTERDSNRVLRVTPQGEVTQVGTVPGATGGGEGGLLGLAISPAFASDRLVYLYFSTGTGNRIARATLGADGALGPLEPLVTAIPGAAVHDGGRLAFGPDGMLYAATGDATERRLAQDPGSLAGKILRMTPEGEPAPGNPFPGSIVYSLGHRNVQGLAFDAQGRLWASEFGSDEFDELNLIRAGGNYGWPIVEGRDEGERFIDPLVQWPVAEASPSGIAVVGGSVWIAALRGERLWQVPIAGDGVGEPVAHLVGDFGRLRSVERSGDCALWVTTSNRDGRGDPAPPDDRILQVAVPCA